MERGEDRAAFLEHLHVLGLVVGSAIFPTVKENANPLECQSTNDGVKILSLLCVVIQVVTRPLTFKHRQARELVEGLAQELRAGAARVDDSRFAAAFGYGCYSAEALEVACGLITRAVGAEGHQ